MATDIDWQHGDGDEVNGPAESILMVLAGRPHAIDELQGSGCDALRERVAGASSRT